MQIADPQPTQLDAEELTCASDDVVPPGTVLGSYRVDALLAKGGMGNIYVAEHLRLGRRVALKMLRSELNANQQAVARFFAEARAVNKISHDNIVEITDFVENQNGHNYFIMPLLRGQDLGQILFKIGIVPIAAAIDIAIQVASGLAAVHDARIVHRDLKPDNIFLVERPDRRNFVKLLDFGVAKLGDIDGVKVGTTCAGMLLGTPEYMSPEQACGQPVDHRADIYALGVVLYEMVTGISPFKAKSFGETLINHCTVPPKPPSECPDLPHEIPAALEELILSLLEKAADDRPQSMQEVEARLIEIQEARTCYSEPRPSGRVKAVRASSELPVQRSPSAERRARLASSPSEHAFAVSPTLASGDVARDTDASAAGQVVRTSSMGDVSVRPRKRGVIAGAIAALALAGGIAVFATRGDDNNTAAYASPAPTPVEREPMVEPPVAPRVETPPPAISETPPVAAETTSHDVPAAPALPLAEEATDSSSSKRRAKRAKRDKRSAETPVEVSSTKPVATTPTKPVATTPPKPTTPAAAPAKQATPSLQDLDSAFPR